MLGPPNRIGLEAIFAEHQQEHAAVDHFFGDMVPDTLFYGWTPQWEWPENQYADAMKTNPFVIQEGIHNAVTIAAAAEGPIAENPQFPKNLTRLLDAFERMAEETDNVPDIPRLNYPNVLVDPDGKPWVVDTNTLVGPEEYYRFGFNFPKAMTALIRNLEKGYVPGNPQG